MRSVLAFLSSAFAFIILCVVILFNLFYLYAYLYKICVPDSGEDHMRAPDSIELDLQEIANHSMGAGN